MLSLNPLSAFPKPTQVILGITESQADQPESSTQASKRSLPHRDNVSYLAGRDARDSVIVQVSFDQVCVLARDQRFDQALPFWDAFSGSQNTDRSVTCTTVGLSADGDQILIAAAMDHRIAVWHAPLISSSPSRKWKVHSTLMINDGVVTALDIVKGQLLTGTTTSLALWRLDSTDIPIWRRFWTKSVPAPISIARFSPDATSIAAVAQGGQYILLWQYQPRASKPPIFQQRLYHARTVDKLTWRQPPEANSQADVLISYASDGVARIWAPVIDEPTQLRLWCSVEGPRPSASSHATLGSNTSKDRRAFYLDPHVVCAALRTNVSILQREIQMAELGVGSSTELDAHAMEMNMDLRRTRLRRLEQLANETPDMFLSFEQDGFLSLTAVANIDRRPPTLLQAFTVLRVPFAVPTLAGSIAAVTALPLHVAPDSSSTTPMLTLHVQLNSGTSRTYAVNPATFFDGRGLGIETDTCHPCGPPATSNGSVSRYGRHSSRISRLHRSGDGKTLHSSAARESLSWSLETLSTQSDGELHYREWSRAARLTALSWDGSLIASLLLDGAGEVRGANDGSSARFDCDGGVETLAFSSMNDSVLLIAVTSAGAVYTWAVETQQKLHLKPLRLSHLWEESQPDRRLTSIEVAPSSSSQLGNDLRVVTSDSTGQVEVREAFGDHLSELRWKLAASFGESSSGVPQLVCSNSDGLVAVVYRGDQDKKTLVIYNSKTTSFTSGEEHRQVFDADDSIIALDWSPSPLSSSALALVFEHHVDVIAPGRLSITNAVNERSVSRWVHLARLDLRSCTPSSIRAACWLGAEQIVVASGSVLYAYGPWIQPTSLVDKTASKSMHLSELLAEVGGPVVQYHPSFLLQCAIWGRMTLAKAIISNLETAAHACNAQEVAETWSYDEVPLDIVLRNDSSDDRGASRNGVIPRATQHGVFSMNLNSRIAQPMRSPFRAQGLRSLHIISRRSDHHIFQARTCTCLST